MFIPLSSQTLAGNPDPSVKSEESLSASVEKMRHKFIKIDNV